MGGMVRISSTNRNKNKIQIRDENKDYYITPIDKIQEFLNEFIKHEPNAFIGQNLDCCAGGDKNHLMSYPEALKSLGIHNVHTIDIREDSLAANKCDYLQTPYTNIFDMIITNPPFNIAREIIEKALIDVKDNGFVIMLLRLNFFGGKLRKDLWDKQMPKYAFVHNKRLSFTDDNKTDSIEYMHCVWQKGYYPEFTQIKVI